MCPLDFVQPLRFFSGSKTHTIWKLLLNFDQMPINFLNQPQISSNLEVLEYSCFSFFQKFNGSTQIVQISVSIKVQYILLLIDCLMKERILLSGQDVKKMSWSYGKGVTFHVSLQDMRQLLTFTLHYFGYQTYYTLIVRCVFNNFIERMEEQLFPELTAKKFFFFVNSKSGDGEGAKLIQISRSQQLFQSLPSALQLQFVDLSSKQQLISTLQSIGQEAEFATKQLLIIICGGDGTISWVLNEIVKSKIKVSALTFGLFPIGTGNDMCRSLGWDLDLFEITVGNLVKIVKKWTEAQIVKYDIWQVTLQTFKNGKIYSICSKTQLQNEGLTLKKVFTNYVGLSMDARIVYTMQRYRTPSACINKILYGLVGCLNFFKPLKQLYKKINSFTDKCPIDRQSLEQTDIDSNLQVLKDIKEIQNQRSLLNSTNIGLKKGYRGIVCLNCTSYMCGLRNIWQTGKVGSKQPPYDWKPQSFNDGMVQFVAYKTELSLALERIVRSGAKISQGCGPFQITLNKPEKNEIQYIQIDGESVKIKNLRSIRITKCSQVEESKINILCGL